MGGISTMLAERVESLLPHAHAAACVPNSPYCSEACYRIDGTCYWLRRYCHLSCHGKGVCGNWQAGLC